MTSEPIRVDIADDAQGRIEVWIVFDDPTEVSGERRELRSVHEYVARGRLADVGSRWRADRNARISAVVVSYNELLTPVPIRECAAPPPASAAR